MKRTEMFQVRMSKAELETLRAKAEAQRLPVGTWARMVLLAAAASALLLATPARAFDWTWRDTAWEGAFAVAVVMDAQLTKDAMRRGWEEGNPLVGKHPSNAQLNALMVGIPVVHAAISALLPEGEWRRGWQAVTLGVEAHAVCRSYTMGLTFKF